MKNTDSTPKDIICHRPWTGFEIVDHLGDVRPCCWGKKSCGNVNEQTVGEIWNGTGFYYYREKMLQGETEAICKPSCPILQGRYKEKLPHAALHFNIHNMGALNQTPAAPAFLRIVPTITCNLRCPMCYQIGDPPTSLPDSLFESLEPWIKQAFEFQILGGEPFIAKECLSWIRRLDPASYPNLRLAAITNGLGFTPSVCELIASRNWNWILVSVDAASANVYKRVRGGDYDALLNGLDRLVEIRAKAQTPFEVRFGFTLQKSNLKDALQFLDLCDEYNAVPQYTLVFGDWHNESPSTSEDYTRFYATLEKLDKRLWELGFDNKLLGGVFGELTARSSKAKLHNSEKCYPSSTPEKRSENWLASNTQPSSQTQQFFPLLVTNSADYHKNAHPLTAELLNASSQSSSLHLIICVNASLKRDFDKFKSEVSKASIKSFSIKVPYFEDGKPVSSLEVFPLVEFLKEFGESMGWAFLGGDPDPTSLGLLATDCVLQYEKLYENSSNHLPLISVISPINNCEEQLPVFLQSLIAQDIRESFEVILVEDMSGDRSLEVTLKYLDAFPSSVSVTLLRTKRTRQYKKGTFTFGAGLARQIGFYSSSAQRILFLDPDQHINLTCVGEHLEWAKRSFDVVIGDRIEPRPDIHSAWNVLRTASLIEEPYWWLSFFTGNASVDRTILETVGGFDSSLQYWGLDDTDLAYRLFKAGASVWHTTRAQVTHLAPDSSGGGVTRIERLKSYRLHMEVLYRKYLDPDILKAFKFVWHT